MTFFNNFRLNAKFNIILALIFVALLFANSIDDYLRQQDLVQRDAIEYSRTIARQIVETRAYLSNVLHGEASSNPALTPQIAATQIAKRLSKDNRFIIRQVSLRYRNPENSPDQYETEQLKTFAVGNPKESARVIKVNGDKVLRYLLPMIAEESCLECHGSYEKAPTYIQDRFPRGHFSYNYKVGEVIGALSVSIPMSELYSTIGSNLKNDLTFSGILVLIIILLMGALIRHTIIVPIMHLSETISNATRTGSFPDRLPVDGKDEIAMLISAYNDMMEELGHRILQRQESEERYRNVMELAQSPIITFIEDGKIVIANRAAEKFFGLPTEDLIGLCFYDFIKDGDGMREEIVKKLNEDPPRKEGVFNKVFKDIRGQCKDVELALSSTTSVGHHMFTVIINEVRSI